MGRLQLSHVRQLHLARTRVGVSNTELIRQLALLLDWAITEIEVLEAQ